MDRLEELSGEPGAGAAAQRVEQEEALQTLAAVGHAAQAVDDRLQHRLADGVEAAGVVVGGVLVARLELLGVVEVTVLAGPHLVCRHQPVRITGKNQCPVYEKTVLKKTPFLTNNLSLSVYVFETQEYQL